MDVNQRRRAMLACVRDEGRQAHAAYRILVLDKTRFDLPLRCAAGSLADYHAVITDSPLPDRLRSPLAAQGVRFLC